MYHEFTGANGYDAVLIEDAVSEVIKFKTHILFISAVERGFAVALKDNSNLSQTYNRQLGFFIFAFISMKSLEENLNYKILRARYFTYAFTYFVIHTQDGIFNCNSVIMGLQSRPIWARWNFWF